MKAMYFPILYMWYGSQMDGLSYSQWFSGDDDPCSILERIILCKTKKGMKSILGEEQ